MSAKKYVAWVVGFMFVFMAAYLALWHLVVKESFIQGDLNRTGNFVSSDPLTPEAEYSKSHIELKDYFESGKNESFDILTLGDSFSNGGGRVFYQDYLADKYGLKSINARPVNHCLQDLYILMESGTLDRLQPSAVILESVGRAVHSRLGVKDITLSQTTRKESEIPFWGNGANSTRKQLSSGFFAPVMTEANKKFVESICLRMYDTERLSPEVYIKELDREFFTNPGYENILLYYCDDFLYLNHHLNAEMMNRNLNNAAKILADKNIKLIFMPCVDKYDLYYPYITDKRGRPENPLFDELRNMPGKNYIFIDTKAILRKELEHGEKDIYWFGDTHWSWRGAEKVCDELAKYLCPEKLN